MSIIDVVIQDELGKTIRKFEGPLHELSEALPGVGASHYALLSGIDFYGDTLFNQVQLVRFLEEWHELKQNANERWLEALEEVGKMAEFCLERPGRYLRFMGD